LKPDGAFYAFLSIDGVRDSRKAAIEIVDKCGVGLAPGSAFGQSGETFLRACFLRDGKSIEEAADRLSAAIPFL
jgi:aspartate/methionine/tyrosine aminotransferase